MSRTVNIDLHIIKSENNLEQKLFQHMIEIKEELERTKYDEITIETRIKQMSKTQYKIELDIREAIKLGE